MSIRELRAIFEPELTQVYVFYEDLTPIETPIGVAGWHHKTFPKSLALPQILETMKQDDSMFWPQDAPPE